MDDRGEIDAMTLRPFEAEIDDAAARVAREARDARAAFTPPDSPPDEERALECARDGLGDTVAVYIRARTADDPVRFSDDGLSNLHDATNHWLAMYAACYGVDMNPEFTVREVAELLVDTHDIVETAGLLTGVPERS